MFVSQVSLEVAKKYCRIDHEDDDDLVQAFIQASKEYVKSYTGLSEEAIETKESITPAVLMLCADMYDNRSATDSSSRVSTKINMVLDSILGMHSINLI